MCIRDSWGTQLESTQNNRSQQSPEGQEIHNQSSQSRPRNHKLRQINVQGNWNQQRNTGPSGVDQNSPHKQMEETGINTSQPTKSQTNKKPVKTKNTSNAGVSVSSGSSGDVYKRQFGTYLRSIGNSENNQVQGNKLEREKDNIRENILRYPQVMRQLERECQLAEKIQQLEDELYYPKYYAYAKVAHMIYENEIMDVVYKRSDMDPMPRCV